MNKREKTLLAVFLGVFAVTIGGGLMTFSLKSWQSITSENEAYRRRVENMKQTIAEGARWQQRNEWLEAHAPSYASPEEASAKLLEAVQSEAGKAGVTLGGRELVREEKNPEEEGAPRIFEKTSVKLTLSSVAEKQLFTWLHSMQKPTSFLGITNIQIEPSAEGKTVNCEVQVTHFYHENHARQLSKAG